LVVPGAHGVNSPCIDDIQKRFLETGRVGDLDTSCTAGIRLPAFQTGEEKE